MSNTGWKRFRLKVRNRLISGVLVLVPIAVTLAVMSWVLGVTAGRLQEPVQHLVDWLQRWAGIEATPALRDALVTLISVAGFLLILYAAGWVAQDMAGKRLIRLAEMVVMRVPLASTVYAAAKQLMEAVSLPDRSALRSVVMVEFPRPGIWSLAFLTGTVEGPSGREMCKIFLPTTPNPTTGFFLILERDEVHPTALTVEEAFKMIISGGIVSPPRLGPVVAAPPAGEAPPPA